jgi:DNA modification methylase
MDTLNSSLNPSLSKLDIVQRKVSDLKPDPNNARIHKPRQIKLLAKSIESFGFNVPILIDGENHVLAGHGRLLACQQLGILEVPTISLAHLSSDQAKAFMLADNRLTEIATWDDKLLGEQLKFLSSVNLDFDIESTGFSVGEIDLKIEALEETPKVDTADTPLSLTGPAVTVLGDVWQLGPHRLLCGNSLEESAYMTLMAGNLAAVVFCDVPYNVKVDGHVGGKGAIKHREFAMASGEMNVEEFTAFLTTAFTHMAKFSQLGAIHFQCIDWRHLPEILDSGKAVYSELKNLCVWDKGQAGMGSFYRSMHELILVYKYGQARHQNNVELGRFGRHRTNIWRYPGIHSMRHGEEGDLLALHPTVKPIRMVADAILDCSRRGEIVLDAFLGSGTTLLAAERTGRICYGLEIDPLYVDTAILRWQNLTGQDAVHIASGQTFTQRQLAQQTNNIAQASSDKEVSHG